MSLDNAKSTLLTAAQTAAENAYAPYSGFRVGAAVLGENGRVYTGCNIENASYGLTNCAERTAIFKMVSEGCKKFTALAIYSPDSKNDVWPCGACRQVMVELCASPDTPVYIMRKDKTENESTVARLMPASFSAEQL